LAVFWDPAVGEPGFGWTVAATAGAASAQALQSCQQTAGLGRAAYCVESDSQCDTKNAPVQQ
jgi:hypothetical protein